MKLRAFCFLMLTSLVYNAHAQAVDWLIKTDNGPIMTSCYDSTNEQIYIGGHTKDSLVINDSLVFPKAGHMDGFTSVFDKNGSHKWTKIWPNLRVMHVQADKQGDVFVTGAFDGSTTIGDTTYTAKGAADGCIMKLSAEGEIKWFVAFGNLASTILGKEHVEVMNITNNSNCLLYCHFPQGSYTYYDEEEIRVWGDVILSVDSAGQLNYFKKMPDLNNPSFQNYNKDSTRLTANFSGDLTIDSISISAINYKKSAFTSFFDPSTGEFNSLRILADGPENDFVHFNYFDTAGTFYGCIVIIDSAKIFDQWVVDSNDYGQYNYVKGSAEGSLDWFVPCYENPPGYQHNARWMLPFPGQSDLVMMGGLYNGNVALESDTSFASNLIGSWSRYTAWYSNGKLKHINLNSPTAGSVSISDAYLINDYNLIEYGTIQDTVVFEKDTIIAHSDYSSSCLVSYKIKIESEDVDTVLGEDTFCHTGQAKLWVENLHSWIRWNNGSLLDTITISKPGEYYYEYLTDEGLVEQSTSKYVEHFKPLKPIVQADGDSLFMLQNGEKYQWYLNGEPIGQDIPYHVADTSGSYTARYWKDSCISPESEPYNLNITNILNQQPNAVDVYPNPTSHTLIVKGVPVSEVGNIRIMDLQGRQYPVRTSYCHSLHIDVSGLPAQLYIISIWNHDNVIKKKFLVTP